MPAAVLRTSPASRYPRTRRHHLLRLPILWSLAVLAVPGIGAAQAPAGDRALAGEQKLIGTGDPRDGYESRAFATRSRSITQSAGRQLDLAALAAHPPLGLPPVPDPPDKAAIELGRRLFFDRRLSANETLSCGMCHVPEQAFTQNELATPVGIEGRFVRRNAPSLYNVAYRPMLFHDGRETSLAEQIYSPLLAENEMGNADRQSVLNTIAAIPEYAAAFAAQFPDGLTEHALGQVLADYQRALLSADSPFDRWFYGGEADALDDAGKNGFFLFNRSGCSGCHTFNNRFAHFTDDAMHRTGVEISSRAREAEPAQALQLAPGISVPLAVKIPAPERNDAGRQEVTGQMEDEFRYRTPSLRNVALTAPYMHDGSLSTLAQVVSFYNSGAGRDPRRSPSLKPLGLTAEEQLFLIAFLESLTGSNVEALAADARSVPIGDR